MVPDLAVVVQEPAPSEAPPRRPVEASDLTVLEGPVGDTTRRWLIAEAGPDSGAELLLAELADRARSERLAAFTASAMGEHRSPRFRPGSVSHVMPVAIPAPPDEVEEVDRWYEEEHAELLLRCPDWLRVRRYAVEPVMGPAWSRLALHDLSSPDVLTSAHVRHAMATPWRERLGSRPWFLSEGRDALAVRRPET